MRPPPGPMRIKLLRVISGLQKSFYCVFMTDQATRGGRSRQSGQGWISCPARPAPRASAEAGPGALHKRHGEEKREVVTGWRAACSS